MLYLLGGNRKSIFVSCVLGNKKNMCQYARTLQWDTQLVHDAHANDNKLAILLNLGVIIFAQF
jgi:hypothetical protein